MTRWTPDDLGIYSPEESDADDYPRWKRWAFNALDVLVVSWAFVGLIGLALWAL